jgi:hypothetical protein
LARTVDPWHPEAVASTKAVIESPDRCVGPAKGGDGKGKIVDRAEIASPVDVVET